MTKTRMSAVAREDLSSAPREASVPALVLGGAAFLLAALFTVVTFS